MAQHLYEDLNIHIMALQLYEDDPKTLTLRLAHDNSKILVFGSQDTTSQHLYEDLNIHIMALQLYEDDPKTLTLRLSHDNSKILVFGPQD